MDYGRLRAAALRDGEDEEAVTVDTRALIDKVLARYSGEWTTLRELIQNAADAQATTVKIKWETLPSVQVPLPSTTDRSEILKHILTNHTLRRLVVQNNGQPFTKTDWGRLKRIAEGNPDETKIGAFGVGFYSVFADCEEPFVSSGPEAMAFYWKGNALFTRKLQLPEDQRNNSDTAFVLDYRNTTTTLPNLLSVSQFLATSLTFVALEHIEFWIDDYKILGLHKKSSPSAQVALSRDVETTTKERLMKIQSVERASAQIDAAYMSAIGWKPQAAAAAKGTESYGMSGNTDMPSLRSFFSRLTTGSTTSKNAKVAKEEKAAQDAISEDITAISTSSIFLRVTTAAIKTSVASSFAAELERATKKPPPKVAKLSILTSSYDEAQASEKSASSGALTKATDVFASVLPTKKPGGRIFIGFPTTQTTGAGLHISAPSVIPTVEREAIDLNARWVRTWNIEMLRAAGIMTRIAFCHEMEELQQKVLRSSEKSASGITAKEISQHMPEAKHILNAFTFGDSTPSGHVSQIIEESFWTSYKKPCIEVYSSRGVLPTTKVRLGSEELAKFVSGIPIIPPELKDIGFVQKLIDFVLLTTITVQDVRDELSGKPLNKNQLVSFIQWVGKTAASGELDVPSRDSLLDVAVAIMSEDGGAQGDIIALGNIRNYLSPNKIPAGLPVPPTTIPLEFTSKCTATELQALGWDPLEIVPWIRFVGETGSRRSDEQNLTKSPKFALQILTVLSKNWDNLNQGTKNAVISLLQAHTVMPTKLGMRKPTEAFFPSVKLFDDLPTIEGCSSLKDKFLTALGVRKTLDLDTIFKRLLSPSAGDEGVAKSQWSHVELIKYLASVRADIPNDDLRKLKESRICPAEAGPSGQASSQGTSQLYKVSELFEPKPALRNLQLRLLQWPAGGLRPGSPEGRFLASLGLRSYPTVPELVDMMASSDASLRDEAMNYFIANHHSNGYASFNIAAANKAFLPLLGNPKQLVPPSGCFTNVSSSVLGFDILKRELHAHANKFGVVTDPPIVECATRLLRKPPTTHGEAVTLFEYFATRINELGENVIVKLRDSPIVPVTRSKRSSKGFSSNSNDLVRLSPRQCYLGSSLLYGDIFDFVDFGSAANAFLFRCGSKTEPTKLEIAHRAADEPAKLLSALQSPDKYLNLLRTLADDMSALKKDKDLWKKMKAAPFLLAFKEISVASKEKGLDTEEEEAPIRHYQLASPQQIVILDDYISYRLFKEHLICAPEEDVLEAFYMALGSPTLANTVQEDLRIGPHSSKQEGALWLRKHVLERSKIFIHEYARHSRDAIKHDAKWLETHLSVQVVRSVALRRSLRGQGQSHTEKRSAASSKTNNGWVLYVAAENARPDMYQVGQAVCHLILNRPSQQAYFFFEPFLKLDLLDLRARGYNVDRILRAKAAEARIAEEERRKALDAEQTRIREREQEFRQQTQVAAAAAREHNRTPPPRMPGGFDSPEDKGNKSPPSLPEPSQNRRSRGLFSNLSKRFGFDTWDEPDDQPKHAIDSAPEPVKLPPAEASSSKSKQDDDGRVTNPAVIQQNLLNAIKSTRSHDSSQLFAPPTTQDVREEAEYCDENAGHDLEFAADASNGMRVFVSRTDGIDIAQFLASHHRAINAFAALIRDIGVDIYAVRPAALHLFYNTSGSTVAFNRDGSLFCNFRFFLQLHAQHFSASADGAQGHGLQLQLQKRAEAAVWWWVVLAHELSHNIVKPHNSQHSFYTESFVQQYFPNMFFKVTQMMNAVTTTSPGLGGDAHGVPSRQPTIPSEAPPPYMER
ncbi:hypothetical protein SLS62_011197 [Diatrype stigma]|uniref:Sacsin/Nov domain-containing protein n=1 Tax=Diatrype stigma TaxID=117547 RepID=A0AAN9YG47_9PEZI